MRPPMQKPTMPNLDVSALAQPLRKLTVALMSFSDIDIAPGMFDSWRFPRAFSARPRDGKTAARCRHNRPRATRRVISCVNAATPSWFCATMMAGNGPGPSGWLK